MEAKKYAAELIGTFWLTFAGCGSAVIAAGFLRSVSACSAYH
jgi:aquaporin Z